LAPFNLAEGRRLALALLIVSLIVLFGTGGYYGYTRGYYGRGGAWILGIILFLLIVLALFAHSSRL
jgi:hypothetical protein